MKQMLN